MQPTGKKVVNILKRAYYLQPLHYAILQRNNMKQIILILFFTTFVFAGFSQNQPTAFRTPAKFSVENQNQLELKVYPNPTKIQKVNLEMSTDEITEIHLVSIVGKEVLTKKFDFAVTKYEMPLENVPEGIYLIQVKTTENKTLVKKLMVSGS